MPKICPKENAQTMDRGSLFCYLSQLHVPSRMVVAGVGVAHEELVRLASEHFMTRTPVWETDKELVVAGVPPDLSPAQYTGGLLQVGDLRSVFYIL